jgi:hypothetical protein
MPIPDSGGGCGMWDVGATGHWAKDRMRSGLGELKLKMPSPRPPPVLLRFFVWGGGVGVAGARPGAPPPAANRRPGAHAPGVRPSDGHTSKAAGGARSQCTLL